MPRISTTDLDVFPLCLGGNVFGWTVDEPDSFAVLDAYAAAGGNFIDTADAYSMWADGNSGGESETIIGRWMAARGNRDRMIIATKVAKLETRRGLSAANIRAAAEDSLRRLGTDRIDLYYAHEDDETVPLAETLGAFDELVTEGKVRYVGASNFDAARLDESLEVSQAEGLTSYVALQPHYNLMARDYESELRGACENHDLACIPYFALAKGFLTGKYRRDGDAVDSVRAPRRRDVPRRPRRRRSGRARRPGLRPCDDRGLRGARLARGSADRGGADRERPNAGAARRPPADGIARAHGGRARSAHRRKRLSGEPVDPGL